MNLRLSPRAILTAAIVLSLGAGFGGGVAFSRHRNNPGQDAIITQVVNQDHGADKAVDFSLFWQVWDRLHEKYVDQNKLEAQKLVYGAIAGMVDAVGDPYTTFFQPVTAKKFQEEVSGAFSGVGMEIGKRDGVITVIAPIKDSPALKAGILTGDVIAKIDDKLTDGMSVDEAVDLIRGKKGTSVRLTIARKNTAEPLVFTVVRDTIRIPAVDWKMLDGHVAYLSIHSFNANVDDEFAAAAQEILRSDATRLIVDLRGNPGGLLDSAVDLGGWFLQPGSIVVQEKYGNDLVDQLRAQGNARLASLPTVVLMDGGSASAAEILAGALHDVRGLPLVGEKSFGKGSVQQVESFYNGSALKVTIAKWLTPNGISISDTGIVPTVPVTFDPKAEKDPQLEKALEIVNGLR